MPMPMAMATFSSSSTFKIPLLSRNLNRPISSFSSPVKTRLFNSKSPLKSFGLFEYSTNKKRLGFCLNAAAAENGEGEKRNDDVETMARGESTMPDRFRYLTKEAPDPPLIWPWFVALGFILYAWRAVLFELANWRKGAVAVVGFVGYLLKLLLAVIFHFFGDPITSLIGGVETLTYAFRAFYSSIVSNAPVPELTTIIVLASAVLAIAEAVSPNSITTQPYLLTISGLIGYAAVRNFISEPVFWTLLVALYGFSRLVRKRDHVTSALPAAAVLAAIGESWVRVLVMFSYLALAIFHNSRKLLEVKEEADVVTTDQRVPVPLLCAALAIGIRFAAKWAGYRHLTWMIV
ncbi:uncharacterized protein LOC126655886 [Mercurialis annua]|uniref:uncharacterized protein LOC126655886 n=1 Tax=Mercurialis annua TaxID=3986 RepID=UPI00215EE3C4|nr:uncharacterized protein LOC126655886 [Mercurialis annua]